MAQTLQYVVDPGSTNLIDAITELDVPTIKEKEDSVSYTEGNWTIFSQFWYFSSSEDCYSRIGTSWDYEEWYMPFVHDAISFKFFACQI